MQYLYRKDAKKPQLRVEGDDFRYLKKVKRYKRGDTIPIRNLEDNYIYYYQIENISKNRLELNLIDQKESILEPQKELNIGWCIVEPKVIEKMLPSLNEIGVTSITFIYCKRSQRNFKLDFNRLRKILINSSQQCGRANLMKLRVVEGIKEFLKLYPDAKMLNFSDNKISSPENIKNIVIGCEGGFSDDEVELFRPENIIGFKSPLILRSQTAVCSIASIIMLSQ